MTSPRPSVLTTERRARIGLRHALAPTARGDTVADAAPALRELTGAGLSVICRIGGRVR